MKVFKCKPREGTMKVFKGRSPKYYIQIDVSEWTVDQAIEMLEINFCREDPIRYNSKEMTVHDLGELALAAIYYDISCQTPARDVKISFASAGQKSKWTRGNLLDMLVDRTQL